MSDGHDTPTHPSQEPGMLTSRAEVRVDWYDGDRRRLLALFAEAEDSMGQLESYLDTGRVLVAHHTGNALGHLQLVETHQRGEIELKSMAVEARLRGAGIGTMLVARALDESRAEGRNRMIVATAAADIDNLRFYQRQGFRFSRIEPDAFGPETGYPEGLTINGIPLRDRVWFEQTL